MAGSFRFPRVRCARHKILGSDSGAKSFYSVSTALMFLAASAVADPIPRGDLTIELETVASGLVAPVGVTNAGDGSGRLFIVDQAGEILILDNGVLLATPFLDISSELPELNPFFDERGLLGLAFHPDYENNGRFFVRHSVPREGEPDEPCADPGNFIPGCHSEVLAEYAVSAGDPNVADPSSRAVLFSIDEPQFNHNSGEVAFGPDGFLYFTLGDGGGAHDGLADVPPSHGPIGNGQNIETILGSMLRIDVDNGSSLRVLRAVVDGSQANAGGGTGSPGTGVGAMTLNEDTNEFCLDLSFEGLLGNQTVQHVHGPATPAQNAAVMFGIPGPGSFAGFCTIVSDAQEQIILDGLAYINIHSDLNPGGEIRGNIRPVYSIPPDNPFVGVTGVDEIYAYGMRNPYKFSFDDGPGGTDDLFVADVGQNLFEEVNIVENGGNYGWVIREGLHCFDPFNPLNPPAACPAVGLMGEPLLDPIVEYSHPDSGFDPEGGITVIGGFVYRGSHSPSLLGRYLFGDFAQQFVVPSGRLYFLEEPAPDSFEIREFQIGLDDRPYGLFLKGFGEGEDGEVYACGSTALAPFGDTGVVQRIVEVRAAAVDIKPGSCPNPLNRNSHGVLPVAILGTDTLDAGAIDLSTVRISRADGVGGSAAPNVGPPGPGASVSDVGTPFDGADCDCHDADGDNVLDLLLKFRMDDLLDPLELNGLASGALVELQLTGSLNDGSPFVGSDCVRLVPPGTPPGLIAVQSNAAGAWIDIAPLDVQLDGGGFADFERTFPMTTVATLTVEAPYEDKRFVGWKLDGEFQGTAPTITIEVDRDILSVEAILLFPGDMNGDDRVNLVDFAAFAVCFGAGPSGDGGCAAESQAASDLNGDGKVDLLDFAVFAVNFGS